MNEKIKAAYDSFQIADFDNDMIGILKSLVDFIKVLRHEIPNYTLPEENTPPNFFIKLEPHLPRMDLRVNIRTGLEGVMKLKYEDTVDYVTHIKNIYVVILAIAYFYHMPIDKMIEESKKIEEFTREQSKNILLEDKMSPNWVQEPSGRDYSGIMV